MLRILGLSGSLRRDVAPYDADLDVEPADPAVARLRAAIADADGVLAARTGAADEALAA